MKNQTKSRLGFSIIALGGLVIVVLFLLHPEIGRIDVLIDGHPMAAPLTGLAALPAIAALIVFVLILAVLAFIGVGMMLFTAALSLALMFILLLVPNGWPLLLLIFLIVVALLPLRNSQSE